MNRNGDVARAAIAILAVCLFMAMVSGCEDRDGIAATDAPIAIGGDNDTPCDQSDFCRVEHDGEGNFTVYTCKVHEPEAIVIDMDADSVIEIDGDAPTIIFDYTDTGHDPNDYLIRLTDDWTISNSITIVSGSSWKSLDLTFEDDRLVVTGDLDMNEAAHIFFNEVLKDMADDYIRSRK